MKRGFVAIFILLIGFLMFQGCKSHEQYASEIGVLDSLREEVTDAAERFGEIPFDQTVTTINTIESDLEAIQREYIGNMPKAQAMMLGSYYESKKICKNFSSRYKRLSNEIERTDKQLKDLSGALQTGATEDTEGNQFTPIYVKEVFTQEVSVAKSLITEIDDLNQRVSKLEMRYEDLKPQITELMDSLGI